MFNFKSNEVKCSHFIVYWDASDHQENWRKNQNDSFKKAIPSGKDAWHISWSSKLQNQPFAGAWYKKAISPKHGEVPGSGSPLPQSAMEHTGQQLLPWSDL